MVTITIDHAVPSPSNPLSTFPVRHWHTHPWLPLLQFLLPLIQAYTPACESRDTTPSRYLSQYFFLRSSHKTGLLYYENLEIVLEYKCAVGISGIGLGEG